MLDKHGIISQINQGSTAVTIELGCGNKKKHPDAIGIDLLDYDNVDIVGDIFEVLEQFPDHSVAAVYSYHFFEHVIDLEKLIFSLARVMRPGASLIVVVPHFSNPYFYSDHTHKNFFGLYTFSYFASEVLFSRKVPTYQKTPQFELIGVELLFKSNRPFYVRHVFKWLLGRLMNLNSYIKEFYEENLCYFFPCYEIKYRLRKNGKVAS